MPATQNARCSRDITVCSDFRSQALASRFTGSWSNQIPSDAKRFGHQLEAGESTHHRATLLGLTIYLRPLQRSAICQCNANVCV